MVVLVAACADLDLPSGEPSWPPGLNEPEPILSLGRWGASADAEIMASPLAAAVLGDSVVVIADGASFELRAFDLHGRPVWRAGGKGGGPGEFEATPWRLDETVDGSLVAVDVGATRANRYDTRGATIDATAIPPGGDPLPDVYGVVRDDARGGWRVAVGYEERPTGRSGRTLLRLVTHALGESSLPDTLGVQPGVFLEEVELDGRVALRARPDGGGFRASAAGDRIVAAGVDDSVRVLRSDGSPLRAFPLPRGSAGRSWSADELHSIRLDRHARIWLSRRGSSTEPYRRWIVMSSETGRHTPELRLEGDLRAVGRCLVVVARFGEMDEVVLHVFEVAEPVRAVDRGLACG